MPLVMPKPLMPLSLRFTSVVSLFGLLFALNSCRHYLEDYARRNGFPNPTHFTDDGISGTRFDRPGFTAMMEEVEAGNVEAIIVKDDCVILELNTESP